MGVAIRFPWPGRAAPGRASPGRASPGRASPGTRGLEEHKGKRRKPGRRPPERGKSEAVEARQRRGKAGQAKGATRRQRTALDKSPRSFAWLNRILILMGAGVVLVAAVQAWITVQQIPVEQITVTGEMEHTRTTAVQDMVQPALAGGFLGADLQQVREQLEALPWIYQASVRRVWPNALEIHVVEQLPIARWGEAAFLNHEGEVFRPSDREAWQSLPLLRGPEGQADRLMKYYQRLVDMLGPLGLGVAQLEMDDRGEIEAVLSGGQQLIIGGSEFLERMHRFTAVFRTELAGRMDDVERVDLRYERGVAVAFREIESEDETTTKSDKA